MKLTSTSAVECPGCGLTLPRQHLELDRNYNASAECYGKYNELTIYTISKQDNNFIHQHAVDAYAAQHSGNKIKPITIAFALIGLYYANELGYSGKQVQRVHTLLARQKHTWVPLDPPQRRYSLTVSNVVDEAPGNNRDTMRQKWMFEVWECWKHQHDWVRDICNTLLRD